MRILLVPNSYLPQLGGLEIAVASVARELALAGHSVTVVTASPSFRSSKTTEANNIVVFRLPFALPRLVFRSGRHKLVTSFVKSLASPVLIPTCLLGLTQIIKKEKPQIVNLHYIAENAFYVLSARRFADFDLVVNLHGNDIERYWHRSSLSRWLTRTTLNRADMVLANSTHILNQAKKILPEVREKSAVVGNGVYPEEFITDDRFPHHRPYILSIGNFSYQKGFDILVRAFAQVHQECPGVDLIMAGDGHDRDRCQRLAAQFNVNGNLHFLGRVERGLLPALLNGCELFVLPSRKEAFGIVVLEAMAAGKAVVATRVGGVPEIVTHMKDGLLVEPDSPEELAGGIDRLLSDTDLRRRLGAQASKTARQRFSWEDVAERYLRFYQDALREEG